MPDLSVRFVPFGNTEDRACWDAYARENDIWQGYFLSSWNLVFQEAFGHKAYLLAAFRNGKIAGILPLTLVASRLFGRFLVSQPFVNYGGILADDEAVAIALAEKAGELRREVSARSVELRLINPSGVSLQGRENHKVSMLLDLPESSDQLWSGFKDKVRNQIRKARKCGLTVRTGGRELLDDFYQVFCVNMRDLGTPVYAKSFFDAVLRHFPKETAILGVYSDGRCIAAGITYAYGTTLQLPWASSLVSHRDACPNHLLYWDALSMGCEKGFVTFDFGRSTPESGPWRFKKQWGARELPLHWEFILAEGEALPDLSVSNTKFRLAIEAWKRLPLPVANFLGPKIVRGIP